MIRGLPVLLLAAALPCDAADLYRVGGVVINSETGSPVPHAQVIVFRSGTTQNVGIQTAGEDGKFAFDLPQGKFSLIGGSRVSQHDYGVRTPGGRVGTAVVTGPTHDTSHLTFRWFPPGAITGRVVDESGEPVESALVQLIRASVIAGRRTPGGSTWTRTDDRGEYRFALLRGTYMLAVTGTPWYSRNRTQLDDRSTPSLAYRPAYYPSASDASQAAPILVKPGQEVQADFVLSAVAGATVTVKHNAPPELKGLIGLLTEGIGRKEGFQRQETFSGDRSPFIFEGVPPGRYLVRIAGSRGTSDLSGRQIIDVNGLDIDVVVQVHPAPTVSGKVQLKNAEAKPQKSLLASLVREDTGGVASTIVKPDGSFAFPSVTVARWRPAIRGGDGYFASEVKVEGAEFNDGVIDLVDGDTVTLRMTANDEIGKVQGFVMRGDTPVDGVMVVLSPAAGARDQVRTRAFLTDSDGSFDLENVPAEEYLLFAVEDTEIEYTNPAAVRPYLANAKRIRIEPRRTYSEKIPISQPVENQQ